MRTSLWVLADPDEVDGAARAEDLVPQLPDETDSHPNDVDRMDNGPDLDALDLDTPDPAETWTKTIAFDADSPVDMQTAPVFDLALPQTSGDQHVDPQQDLPTHVPDGVAVQGRVVTRAGRVVKSVNRLIESMVQRSIIWGQSIKAYSVV